MSYSINGIILERLLFNTVRYGFTKIARMSQPGSPHSPRARRALARADNPEVRRLQPLPCDGSPSAAQGGDALWDEGGHLIEQPSDPEEPAPEPEPAPTSHMLPESRRYLARRARQKMAQPGDAPAPEGAPRAQRDPRRRAGHTAAFNSRQEAAAETRRRLSKPPKPAKPPRTAARDGAAFQEFLDRQKRSAESRVAAAAPDEEPAPERATAADALSQAVSSAPSIFSSARDELRKAALEAICKAAQARRDEEARRPSPQTLASRETAAAHRAEIEGRAAAKRERLQAEAESARQREQQNAEPAVVRAQIHAVPDHVRMTNAAIRRKQWKPLAPPLAPPPPAAPPQ
jgi:hypothetical protein